MPDHFERLRRVLPRTAGLTPSGHLELGGCDALDLASRFGTPLYVVDRTELRDRLIAFRDAFGARNVCYASKAFLLAGLAPLIAETGVGMDCLAGGELYVALAGGFPADRITVHGNNKSAEELGEALDARVGTIVVDSAHEFGLLEAVAEARGVRPRILVRIAPGIEAHTHDYLKTGVEDTKFGVPVAEAVDLLRAAASSPHLDLQGIHAHIGSQLFDLEPYAEAARVMVGVLARARSVTGLGLPELALGGGLGIAYLPEDEPAPIEAFAKVVLEAVASEAERLDTPVPEVMVEPGRAVIGPAMVTLYTAGAVKDVPGVRRYVAVDGGMSDNIRPPLYGARYTFLSAARPGARPEGAVTIAGKLCESGDILGTDVDLPDIRPGEIVAVAATGAYCYAMASNYNKQPRPAVVAVEQGRTHVLARRETYEDLLRFDG